MSLIEQTLDAVIDQRPFCCYGRKRDDPLARLGAAPERLIRRFHDQASEEAAGQGREPDRPL